MASIFLPVHFLSSSLAFTDSQGPLLSPLFYWQNEYLHTAAPQEV